MDPSAYVWDPNIVTVDTQSFQNPLAGGTFSTSFDLNSVSTYSVYVNFAPNPVPEPAAILGLSAVALCLGSYLRRRNKTTNRMACPVAVRNAFTLLELIVVIAILGVIISLVLPAIQKVRNEGQNLNCQSNLKNIGIAVHQHHDGSIPSDWAEKALPFFDQATLSEMDPNEAGKIPLPIYSCPSAGVPQVFDSGLAAGHYVQNTSVTNLTIAQITAGDGTTVTLMHSEEKAPAAWIISREMSELNLLSWHSKGANGLFCDGHVQFLNDRLDLRIRNQLLNPADGGPVAEDLR